MRLKILPTVVLLFLFCSFVLASPGDLDLSFGIGGRGLIPVGNVSVDQARAAVLQPDSKIIVVGESVSDGQFSSEFRNLLIARLNPDGSKDTSFGNGGIAVKRLHADVFATSVALQADGKIVAGAYARPEVTPGSFKRVFLLVRLLPNGQSDDSFGVGGVVMSVLDSSQQTTLTSIAIQPDGKIVATGFSATTATPPTTPHSLIVARYNTDGTLDNSFDSDGKLFVNVNATGNSGNSVAIQADGKIVIGGSLKENVGTVTDFLVVRLNTDGAFDTSFDLDGIVTTKILTTTSSIVGLAMQSDNKIVAMGLSTASGTRRFALTRYNVNGSLDNTFDQDGVLVTGVDDNIPAAIALQSDGKPVVTGQTGSGQTGYEFLTMRFNLDGSLDNTFDGDGRVVTPFGVPGNERPAAILVQPNGAIIVAGSIVDTNDSNFAVVRNNSNGSPDTTFDTDGKEILELANAADGIYDTAIQPDGKIVAVGYSFDGSGSQPAVARYLADGTVDTTFGNLGSLEMQLSPVQAYADEVVVQPDGKIVFSLGFFGGHPYVAVRLNPDGSFDTSFGTNGVVTVEVAAKGSIDEPRALALQGDGKIVMAGMSAGWPTIVRLTPSGTLDGTFGSGGIVQNMNTVVLGNITAMTLQPDGKIIVAGSKDTLVPLETSFFTSRYNANGSVDGTYGGIGAVFTSVGGHDSVSTVAVQPDGKIVAAGTSMPGSAVVRYNPNGTLDDSFDADGKVVMPGQAARYDAFTDVAIRSDNKIVLVGAELRPLDTFGHAASDALVYRLNADGAPDSSFGLNGRVLSSLGNHDSAFHSVELLPNGKIVAGGISSNGANNDFTLVRYLGGPSHQAPFDFDSDGKTDIAIFRPSVAEWWINRSGTGVTWAAQFGATSDSIVPTDFTGDGKADVAIWRPSSGEWFVLRSEDYSYFSFPFGTNGDVPAPADYDGDGKPDATVYRPSNFTWYVRRSSDGGTTIQQFGAAGDVPVPSDYDGDGKADIAIFRPSAGQWWMNRSTAGVLAVTFGNSTDKLVQGDYTGDGKADNAVFRPSTGEWLILRSDDFSFYSFPFGLGTDVPAPGDYDGDGRFDATVFRPSTSTWYSQRTTAGTLIQQFGSNGDRPIPNAFVP